MKTNQILVRGNSAFVQRTKDKYFNATALSNAWNSDSNKELRESKGYKLRKLSSYKENDSMKEFEAQLKKEGIEKPMISTRGKGGATWMHPKLFIDFAMWVSVEFKSIAIDYVLDGLINSRNNAGDYYNEMTAAIIENHTKYNDSKPSYKIYTDEAIRIRKLLGLGYKDRNEMTEQDLDNITMMQKTNAMLFRDNVGKESRIKQLKFHAKVLKR